MDIETDTSPRVQEDASVPQPTMSSTDLAMAVTGILAGALLLRLQPVRSLVKLGALGAAGWTAYRFAGERGLLSPTPEAADRRDIAKLAAASQRLAQAWGAHYRAPQGDEAAKDVYGPAGG